METEAKFTPDPRLKLMDQVRQVLRYHHYAHTTERTYCTWILRFMGYWGRWHEKILIILRIDKY